MNTRGRSFVYCTPTTQFQASNRLVHTQIELDTYRHFFDTLATLNFMSFASVFARNCNDFYGLISLLSF